MQGGLVPPCPEKTATKSRKTTGRKKWVKKGARGQRPARGYNQKKGRKKGKEKLRNGPNKKSIGYRNASGAGSEV